MKLPEKVFELAVTGAVAGVIAFGGWKNKLDEHERRITASEVRQGKTDDAVAEMKQGQSRMDQKLDDLIDGLGVPKRHREAYR